MCEHRHCDLLCGTSFIQFLLFLLLDRNITLDFPRQLAFLQVMHQFVEIDLIHTFAFQQICSLQNTFSSLSRIKRLQKVGYRVQQSYDLSNVNAIFAFETVAEALEVGGQLSASEMELLQADFYGVDA